MNATLLYRIAAGLLLFFAAGHTAGFLAFKPPSPEAIAVRDAMDSVVIDLKGATYTYGGFYRGFGLTVTAYMVFSALLAWHLGGLAATAPQAIGWIGWAFVAVQLATFALSLQYFFLAPALFSAAVVACLAGAAWLVRVP